MSPAKLISLKIFFLGLSLFMVYLVINTSIKSNLIEVWNELGAQPWMTTTLVDFYFNITIISAWVIYREGNWGKSTLWIMGFIVLGSIATAFYIFLQLTQLKPGDGIEKVLLRKK